jgi:hypothetical protein
MRYVTLASIIFLTFTAQATSQQDEKVSFHVTSVSQADATDYCTTGKCSPVSNQRRKSRSEKGENQSRCRSSLP